MILSRLGTQSTKCGNWNPPIDTEPWDALVL